jgi:hypothetical protein
MGIGERVVWDDGVNHHCHIESKAHQYRFTDKIFFSTQYLSHVFYVS